MDNESKLNKLYSLAKSLTVLENVDSPFFSFKIVCNDTTVYKPQISLYIPYLSDIVQQKFIFNKGWRPLETLFYHSVNGKLNPTLKRYPSKTDMVLEVFTPVGNTSKNFYKNVVEAFELYKVRENLSDFESTLLSDDFSLSNFFTVTQFEMSEFKPDKKFYFTHKEGDLYSGSAYHLDGFNEPEHLGSFYHISQEEVEKNVKSLFL